MIGELEMPVIPENYEERQNNESKIFDDFLKDPEFKNKYEDLKNRIDEINAQKEAAKKELDNSISKWIADHPFTVLTVAFAGTTFISYKLYQRLITTSVYKANIMTLDYIENNIEIVRKTL